MTRKMLSGKGGYDFGTIKEQNESIVTAQKVESFLTLLDHENFWNLEPGDTQKGFDGSYWFIEAVRTRRCQMVCRWSPESNTAVGRIGRHMIEMADWKVENLY